MNTNVVHPEDLESLPSPKSSVPSPKKNPMDSSLFRLEPIWEEEEEKEEEKLIGKRHDRRLQPELAVSTVTLKEIVAHYRT